MAKHLFKKGQSGNPAGRKPGETIQGKLRKLTVNELEELVNVLIKGNIDELKAIADSKKTTVIQAMVAAVAIKIISRGDMVALDALLNRLVGKVKDHVQLTGIPAIPQGVTQDELNQAIKKAQSKV